MGCGYRLHAAGRLKPGGVVHVALADQDRQHEQEGKPDAQSHGVSFHNTQQGQTDRTTRRGRVDTVGGLAL